MKIFHFSSCHDIKMTIMTPYFRIRDDDINFFKFHKIFPTVYSNQVSASSHLNQKIFEKFASLNMFLAILANFINSALPNPKIIHF